MDNAKQVARVGVIHGRFQPLHLGHMEYLLAGKSRCDFLVVGITNPDFRLTDTVAVDPHRSLPTSNPFSYWERLIMVRDSMLDVGIERSAFDVVPFPINFPHLLPSYVPSDAVFYITIYDDWGRSKLAMLDGLGYRTEVMWERDKVDRLTSGTTVRRLIGSGGNWRPLVPPAVADVISKRLEGVYGPALSV